MALARPAETDASVLVAAFAESLPWALDAFQEEAIRKLETHRGVLVSAPTSSGKTVVAEYLVWRALGAPPGLRRPAGTPAHVVYTTPLKALSNQKYRDLCARYGEGNVGLVTGEHAINDNAPVVVMTTEILRNVLYDEPQRLDLVGDVVLDEVHYIDDYPRGAVWEEVIIQAPPHIRMLGLSATISNVDEVAAWMSGLRGPTATVVRTDRPVELRLWLGVDNGFHPLFEDDGRIRRRTADLAQTERGHEQRLRSLARAPDNDLLRVVAELGARDMLPAIYFIFSRRGCREALSRCDLHGIDLTSAAEKGRIDTICDERVAAVGDDDERRVFAAAADRRLLRRGLAMHHAGMLPYAKETVEHLFQAGLIKAVFATETLSLGLNMPARACVVSSFTKFDGTGFHALTGGELTQLMGRAGRRGIDTLGHGIVLLERDTDLGDVYAAAVSADMAVISKFSPTYTMTLNLLRTRTVAEGELLLERSLAQHQVVRELEQWNVREGSLRERLDDLRTRVYRHPAVACTERTLTQYQQATERLSATEAELRAARRDHWRDRRRGRYGARAADPGQRYEAMRRTLKQLRARQAQSPCHRCPLLAEHRGHRAEVRDLEETLRVGEQELLAARDRFRREFRAFRAVLGEAGFLEHDRPTALGALAASLYGESALLVAQAVVGRWFTGMEPPELAATLVMLVAEDRGPDRGPVRRHFPTPRVETAWRALRAAVHRLAMLEREHGLATVRPLSRDFVDAAHDWSRGRPLTEIAPPPGGDIGDVVKAIKNLYSMLRQMEQATRGDVSLHTLVARTRESLERDLLRRV